MSSDTDEPTTTDAGPPARRWFASKGKKLAKWLALGLVALYAGYLVVFNLAFWTGAYEALVNDAQDVVEVRLERAYTVWPFAVHVDHLHLLVDDDAVQIEIVADDVVVDFHLAALRNRIVHMEGVRGNDYVFRLRRRRLAKDVTEKDREALPELAEIDRDVVKEPDPNPDTDLSNNWNVRMDDVDAQFREIWIEGFRFRGDTHIVGGFYLRTEDLLRMPRTEVTFDSGALTVGGRAVASLEGRAAVTISELSFRPENDEHPLSPITLEADLQAALMELAVLDRYLPMHAVTLQGGEGYLSARGELSEGVMSRGTVVDLDLYDLEASYERMTLTTPVDLSLRSDGDEIEARLELGGRLHLGDELPTLVVSQALAHGHAQAADLRKAVGKLRGTLDIQGGASSVHVAASGDGPRAAVDRVAFSTQYKLDEDGALSGAQAVELKGAAITWGDAKYDQTELTARVFARGRLQTPEGLVADAIEGQVSAKGRHGDDAWQGELSIEEGYGTKTSGRIDATIALSSMSPFAAMPPIEKKVPDLAEALLDLDDAEAVARVQWSDGALRLIVDELEVDSGTVTGWLLLGPGSPRGAVHASLPLISVGLAIADGNTNVTLSPDDAWIERLLAPGVEQSPPPRPALPEPTN